MFQQWKAGREWQLSINPMTPTPHNRPMERIKRENSRRQKERTDWANRNELSQLWKSKCNTPSNTGSLRSFQRWHWEGHKCYLFSTKSKIQFVQFKLAWTCEFLYCSMFNFVLNVKFIEQKQTLVWLRVCCKTSIVASILIKSLVSIEFKFLEPSITL